MSGCLIASVMVAQCVCSLEVDCCLRIGQELVVSGECPEGFIRVAQQTSVLFEESIVPPFSILQGNLSVQTTLSSFAKALEDQE